MLRMLARCAAALMLLCVLIGCRREAVAPGDPVAAIKGMAAAIRDDDLGRYSRLSMPPELHRRMQQRWKERLVAAAPPTPEQQRDYRRWMERLTAKDAEAKLYRSFDAKLDKLGSDLGGQWPLMQATGGIFINGLIQANDKLSAAEKAHAKAIGSAFVQWLTPERLTDRARARQAIAVLTESARALGLPTLQDTRALEMLPALRKGGQVLKAVKQVGRIYGIDANAALAGVQARTVSVDGDVATMEVSYPLLGQTIRFEMQLLRRDGRWYDADAVRTAELELRQAVAAEPRPAVLVP